MKKVSSDVQKNTYHHHRHNYHYHLHCLPSLSFSAYVN